MALIFFLYLFLDGTLAAPLELRVREEARDERGVLYRAWCRAPPSYPRATVRWLLGDTVIGEMLADAPALGDVTLRSAESTLDLHVDSTCCTGPEFKGSRGAFEPPRALVHLPAAGAPVLKMRASALPCAGTALTCRASLPSGWNATSRSVPLAAQQQPSLSPPEPAEPADHHPRSPLTINYKLPLCTTEAGAADAGSSAWCLVVPLLARAWTGAFN